ncbi:MAG TPA: alpha/beta hydrolase [Chitinophagales bacterium]|nr:alpha/beta hydrolase [Chitinophagales bacterium]
MISRERNLILQSKHGRPFLVDVYYKKDGQPKPVVIFSHGFKGFKDWGPFDMVADKFAEAGFIYVKFNFSHNGTTVDHPMDFADLEAFGNDNLSIEMDDLGGVIDWVCSPEFVAVENKVPSQSVYLMGHSRGGGISILKAQEDNRVKKLCTWASVNEFSKYWTQEELEKIKRDGVVFVGNARTKQQMPIKWQMYENYFANLPRLFVPDAVKALTIPFLIIHGTDDETIPYAAALEMHQWNRKAELFLLEHSNHNFGGKHPYTDGKLTEDLEDAVNETIQFFKK